MRMDLTATHRGSQILNSRLSRVHFKPAAFADESYPSPGECDGAVRSNYFDSHASIRAAELASKE